MGTRWYDPALGRFISADTIIPDHSNPQSLNRYSYVYNNPVKYTDPTGHCPCLALAVPVAEVALVAVTAYVGYKVLTSEPVQQGFEDLTNDAGKWIREGMTEIFPTEGAQGNPSLEGTPLSDQAGQSAVETFPTGSLNVPNLLITTMAVGQLPTILMAKWAVGDAIDTATKNGYPSWSTVRSRYWKTEAANALPGQYTDENLERMGGGKGPLYSDDIPVSQELHHIDGQNIANPHNEGNLQKVWPWEHDDIDPYRHYNGPRP